MTQFRFKLFLLVGLLLMLGAMVGSWWYYKDRQLIALAKNVYYEALLANEPEESSRMVAYVTGVRAAQKRKDFGGADIHDVVYARRTKRNGVIVCQFSWTCMAAARHMPSKRHLWEQAVRIAQDELAGKFVPPEHLRNATFYLNPKHSRRRNICEFKTRLVRLGKADEKSQHEFYRPPLDAKERAKLPKRKDVEECNPPKPKKKKETSASRDQK